MSYNCDISNIPLSSRIRNKDLAAGSLLDIGIYPLTYSRVLLDDSLGENHSPFQIKSFLTIDSQDQVDHLYSAIVKYQNGKHAVLTASELIDGPKAYVRLEGSQDMLRCTVITLHELSIFKIFNAKGDEILNIKMAQVIMDSSMKQMLLLKILLKENYLTIPCLMMKVY